MMHTSHVFRAQRDLDLRLAARRIINANRGTALPFERLVAMTLESRAPSFYLSLEYARRMVSCYRRGILPSTTSALKRAQWAELSAKVEVAARRYHTRDMITALGFVLGIGNASRFYVSREMAARVLARTWGNNRKGVMSWGV